MVPCRSDYLWPLQPTPVTPLLKEGKTSAAVLPVNESPLFFGSFRAFVRWCGQYMPSAGKRNKCGKKLAKGYYISSWMRKILATLQASSLLPSSYEATWLKSTACKTSALYIVHMCTKTNHLGTGYEIPNLAVCPMSIMTMHMCLHIFFAFESANPAKL